MAQEVEAHLVTAGMLVESPTLSLLVVVSLGMTLHPPCLLLVVRVFGKLASVSVPQCSYNVVCHHHCGNVCVNG